jgi:6-phosphofructokinase 1
VQDQAGEERYEDCSGRAMRHFENRRLDGLIVVGGDGSLALAYRFSELGVPVIGIPKTIDNDLPATDVTFGFDTAVTTATEAIDRLHTTAESHHRVMVVEVMGRNAGWIALHAGLAGGGDVILIPEMAFDYRAIARKIEQRSSRGKKFSIVVVAEGAHPVDGEAVYQVSPGIRRLGGISLQVAERIEALTGRESRHIVLGHLQRGGSPTSFDRNLATRFGAMAVQLAVSGRWGEMVCLQANRVIPVSLASAVGKLKLVDPESELVQAARMVGTSFGQREEP